MFIGKLVCKKGQGGPEPPPGSAIILYLAQAQAGE